VLAMQKRTSQPQNMKYKLPLFFILLISIPSFGQKKYLFDYMMEYDFKYTDTSKVRKEYILTNSKDNSYILKVYEKDSLNFKLDFLDFNGIHSNAVLDKNSFIKSEFITFNCGIVHEHHDSYKYLTKKYDFINKPDTLVDGEHYSQYIFKCNKPKREKRKKLGTLHFIVENNTSFHLPILYLYNSIAYEEWKLERNIPNGIPKEIFMEAYLKKEYYLSSKLKQFAKINKCAIIPAECDYANPENIKKIYSSKVRVYSK